MRVAICTRAVFALADVDLWIFGHGGALNLGRKHKTVEVSFETLVPRFYSVGLHGLNWHLNAGMFQNRFRVCVRCNLR